MPRAVASSGPGFHLNIKQSAFHEGALLINGRTTMFESIKHLYAGVNMTGASYKDGDVIGSVSFNCSPDCTRVISSIGPDDAVRECHFSHRLNMFSNRYRARTNETVEDYSPPA